MKRICMGLVTILAFVVLGSAAAFAQPGAPPPVEGKNIGSPMETYTFSRVLNGDVQEEVEILRRLLEKSFAAVYGPLLAPTGPTFAPGMYNGMAPPMGGLVPRLSRQADSPGPDLQGVYLKDYGVVYTVTLPPPPNKMLPGPTAGVATRTPLSPWERTRKELHGEKIEDEGKPVSGSPPLSEVILKVLADNGKHFTRLAEGERITVVVTFRDDGVYHPQPASVWIDLGMPQPGGSSGMPRMAMPGGAMTGPGGTTGALPPRFATPVPGGSGPYPLGPQSTVYNSSEASKDDAPWLTDVRNSLTLGDLHVKQQNIAAAIAAYNSVQEQLEKGLKAEKDADRILTAAHLYLHLAKGYESAGDNASSRKANQKVGELSKMAAVLTGEAPTAKAALPSTPALPSKLIVTASKKLLDEVGSGKMTFEAFTKAATVEYVKPAAAEKK